METSRPAIIVAVLLLDCCILTLTPPAFATSVATSGRRAADRVAAPLAAALAERPAAARLPIIVLMREQADLEQLDAEIRAARFDRPARAARVTARLRAVARRSQPDLAADLATWQAAGLAGQLQPFWLVNAFALHAAPAVVRLIAARQDVARVFFDGKLTVDRPIAEAPARSAPGQAEIGLRAVGAPTLWGLGYTGTGMLVMNIDSGVDGQHPSLAERWLGLEPDVLATDAWSDHPLQHACPTPCDYDTHGTLVMGIETGVDPEVADTIGVAVDARWIAAAVTGASSSALLNAFQWGAAAPGGTRPPADVINCSLQDPSVGQAGDCGPNGTYWAVVDAFEALGGAVVWSAGNAGPGAESTTLPKNRISTPVNMFATGNVSAHDPSFPIHWSSSRGPSICDHLTPKPEAVAPGTSVRTAAPGGGYMTASGTSLASPHVAGVIALLMEAFPWATGTEIKLALIATATDLGEPGDDNTYGNGMIDAGAAYALLHGAAALREAAPVNDAARRGIILSQNVPNPFNPRTTITFELPSAAHVTLRIFDARGRVVRTLVDTEVAAGRHALEWDGTDGSGHDLPNGIYLYRLHAGDRMLSKKLVLLR